MLTVCSTVALPESWRGDFSVERARAWIAARDGESSTLLVTEIESKRAIGLVILVDLPLDESAVDVRIGYVIAEGMWGRGLATELLSGLIDWARAQPSIHTLTGGVDLTNRASVRVLEKTGFQRISNGDGGMATYQLDVSNEWNRYAESWDESAAARAYSSAAFSSLTGVLRGSGVSLDGANVIDFGCGTGLLTERVVAEGATVEAVDTSTAMLEVLDAKIVQHGWTGVRTSVELPPKSARFDLVVCSSVCSFIDDYPGTVEELAARLQPGGLFVQWDWERTDDDHDGFTRDEIRETLARVGLADIAVGTGFAIQVDGQTMSPLMGHGRRPFDPSRDDRTQNAPE